MQVHAGCAIPEEYLYHLEYDTWVRLEDDGHARIGMTDLAQTRCGKIVSITFKSVGRRIARGRTLAVVESAKWVGPVPSPLSGTLLATNEAGFTADGLIANRDPYGAGWLALIEPDRLDDEQQDLVDGIVAFPRFVSVIERDGISCMRCAE